MGYPHWQFSYLKLSDFKQICEIAYIQKHFKNKDLGITAHIYNPSLWEAEAEE